jgi:hypothetical protein
MSNLAVAGNVWIRIGYSTSAVPAAEEPQPRSDSIVQTGESERRHQ